MKIKNKFQGICLWLMACSVPMMAQEAVANGGDSIELNLDKVLKIALSDNPEIQVAGKTIEIQKYAKKETITGLFPTLTASATGSKNLAIQTIAMNTGNGVQYFKMGQPYSYSLSGTASLPLVAPQLWKTIRLNQEAVEMAMEQARSSKVSTIAGVKNAFYSLLVARDSYNVLRKSYSTSEENLFLTRQKYQVGTVAEYDTLTAFVQHESLKPNLLAAANGVKLAEMQLKVLMGVDVNEPIRFAGSLTDYEEQLYGDLLNLKADTSLAENSSLRKLDIQRRQLELTEKINKLGYLPTLALSLTGGYSAMPEEFNPFDATYFGTSTLSLSFSWNIWDGGTKLMKTRQNRLSMESLDIQRENVVRQLELSIQSSLNNIETAAEQVVSNKASVYAAEKAYTIASKRYEVGSGTQLEKNTSETDLLNARLAYIQSISNFLTNRATLEETLGKVVMGK